MLSVPPLHKYQDFTAGHYQKVYLLIKAATRGFSENVDCFTA
jgi:hypothetical protein